MFILYSEHNGVERFKKWHLYDAQNVWSFNWRKLRFSGFDSSPHNISDGSCGCRNAIVFADPVVGLFKRTIGQDICESIGIFAALFGKFDFLRKNTILAPVTAKIALAEGDSEDFETTIFLPNNVFQLPLYYFGTSRLIRSTSRAYTFPFSEIPLVDGMKIILIASLVQDKKIR